MSGLCGEMLRHIESLVWAQPTIGSQLPGAASGVLALPRREPPLWYASKTAWPRSPESDSALVELVGFHFQTVYAVLGMDLSRHRLRQESALGQIPNRGGSTDSEIVHPQGISPQSPH